MTNRLDPTQIQKPSSRKLKFTDGERNYQKQSAFAIKV